MFYKDYGKTGKKVSALGFGGMRFKTEKNGEYDIDKCAELVKEAYDLGITYFDTAPGYCGQKSEVIMGRAFQDMKGTYYVSTKSSAKDPAKLRKDLETSLQRTGKDKIDFFHIWCVLTMDDYRSRMRKGGPYEEAMKAKSEGLIEHVVISTHCTGDEIETIANEGCFEGITLGYNAINFPFRQKGIKAAYKNNMGVVTMNPLSGGLIPDNKNSFTFIAEGDETPVEAALRFNAAHDEITVVLAGIDTPEHLRQNVAALFDRTYISAERMSNINDKLSASMDKLCTGCRYCEYCPEGIEISKFMQAYNQNLIIGKESAVGMFKWHWGIPSSDANKCIQCGKCETLCTQKLNIIERLADIASW